MLLKPASGRAVRDPAKGTLLPESGAEITLTAFWRKRLRDGDVEEVTATVTKASTTTTASTTTADTTGATS